MKIKVWSWIWDNLEKKVEKLYYFECGSFIPHPYGGVDLWVDGNLVENHILEL
jgi:hypothetical protein